MIQETFDIIVIGGGAGGVPAAIRAAQLGARVAVIEQGHLGGLCMCLRVGESWKALVLLRWMARFYPVGKSYWPWEGSG